MNALVLALFIVGAITAGIELVIARGRSIGWWGVEAIAIGLLIPAIAAA